jgi:Putative Ig domain.
MACCKGFTITSTDAACSVGNEGGTCAFNGIAYSNQYTTTGGTAPFTFTVSAGALPTGLTLSAAGLLSGTPTVNGNYNFTVKATDANSLECTKDVSMDISNTLFLDPRSFQPIPIDPKNMIWTPTLGPYGTFSINFTSGDTGTFSYDDSVIDCLNFGNTSGWEGEAYIDNPCPDWSFHVAVAASGVLQPPGDCPGPIHYDPRFDVGIFSNGVLVANARWSTNLPATYHLPAGGAFSNVVEGDVLVPFFTQRHIEILFAGRMGSRASGTISITPGMRP